MSSDKLNRRDFIKVSLETTGTLLVSISLPSSQIMGSPAKDFKPDAWLRISPKNEIFFSLSKSEMGQGVMTSLAMIIAEELDASLEQIIVEFAPVASDYKDPEFGLQMTGGSSSVRTSYTPLRESGALTRGLFLAAAAQKWQIPVDRCYVQSATVYEKDSSRKATYGELIDVAAKIPLPKKVSLKDKSKFKIIGKNKTRLDNQAKISGTAVFGIDAGPEDSLTAVVVRNSFGRRVKGFDSSAALKKPGIVSIFQISTGVAVVADHYWHASQAAKHLTINWETVKTVPRNTDEIYKSFEKDATDSGHNFLDKTDEENPVSKNTKNIKAKYTIPYMAHATMEPGNATAHVQKDRCDVWAPTQAPELAHSLACEITELPKEQVHIHTTFLGGGFGRRLAQDYVVEAVEISKKIGKPVRMLMSREDDIKHDVYRPGNIHYLEASLSDAKGLESWQHKIIGPSILAQVIPQWSSAMVPGWTPSFIKKLAHWGIEKFFEVSENDVTSAEGTFDKNYHIPNQKVNYVLSDPGIPIGFWRSVGHSYTGFVVESFIDEVAHELKKDPYSYRRELLKDEPKRLKVLDLVAEKSNWGKQKDTFQGIAQTFAFGSYAAQVVDLKVTNGTLSITKVICALDCGSIVHPDNVIAQIEGSIIFALSAAIKDTITFESGEVQQSNFHDYRLIRMNETPEIEVHLVESDSSPQGVGEPAVPPLAPALANAIFAAKGERQRQLPLNTG